MTDNIDILKYIDQRFTDFEKNMNQRFKDSQEAVEKALASSKEAVNKAEEQAEKWRQNANEWRGAMNDRERTFLTRREFSIMITTAIIVMGFLITILKFWQ